LILRGARQVGKTTVVRQFSDEFRHFIYLNLELPADRKPFESFSDFDNLLQSIFFLNNKTLPERGSTLVFIDEIQEVPEAVQMLRYFFEQAPDIPVIAAGSMLESLFDPQVSFPVGRVEYMVIHPVSFPEFLNAIGEQTAYEQMKVFPVKNFAHEKLLSLFRTYCLIGGMPEIVSHYAANKDLSALRSIYESLLVSYIDDVEKYAQSKSQTEHIRLAIRASFAEAGKRIKFQHFGHSSYKSREMGEALRALEKALLIHLVYPQTNAVLPLLPDQGKSPRLHVLDTGMMNFYAGLQQDILGTEDLYEVYQGKVIEHIVGQELLAKQFSALHGLTFWVKEKTTSSAEVDYLYRYKEKLVPIEVKSGSSGKLKSLAIFMDMTNHNLAVRVFAGALSIIPITTPGGKKVKLLNLPYYLISEIDQYLIWLEEVTL
jgi:predicted AAA+ superfamily ATPase